MIVDVLTKLTLKLYHIQRSMKKQTVHSVSSAADADAMTAMMMMLGRQ